MLYTEPATSPFLLERKAPVMKAILRKAGLPSIVLAVILLSVSVPSDVSFAGKSKISPHKLTILFTGDDWGNVKPCS
jgi:hypothetical protein